MKMSSSPPASAPKARVGELKRRAQDARKRAAATKKEAREAKDRAREARRLFKEAKRVAKKARAELAIFSKKLKKLLTTKAPRRSTKAAETTKAEPKLKIRRAS